MRFDLQNMKVLVLLCLLQTVLGERARYDGCNTWYVYPEGRTQVEQLNKLYQENDNEDLKIIFWNSGIRQNFANEVIICPEGEREFQEFLQTTKIRGEIVAENIQRLYDDIFARSDARHEVSTYAYDENDYNTYEDIMEFLEVLRDECSSEVNCDTRSIGDSYHGNEIKMFSIQKPGAHGEKQAIWMDSLIHSGEWLTGPTVLGILTKLVREYGTNDDVTHFVDTYDWYFVPVMNPDGYQFTWDGTRTWRKSRSPNENSECIGTDLNRNYDFLWGNDVGSSGDPCSNTFRGAGAASNPETQHVQREGEALSDRLILWMTYHVQGWVYLFPFGHTEDDECYRSPDEADLQRVGDVAVAAVTATFNDRVWTSGNTCDVFYETSGTTQDWVKGADIAKYIYTPELRGPSSVLPPSEIAPSVEENWNGLVALIYEIEAVESGN